LRRADPGVASCVNTDWAAPWLGLDLTVRWRYIGPVSTDRQSQDPQLSQTYYAGTRTSAATATSTCRLRFPCRAGSTSDWREHITDKAPPIVANGNYSDCPNTSCNDNTWVGTYDTLGRLLYAHVSAKF